ncbi:3-deoxy-manno-octulosonate cytidylyltransferase [Candidatus Hamiltonella defensa]|uniref:3-deoxy-manno-octulosonate cytidylyltransferase n=1 Tax=Hamiltonella defensa subsp. Acyrthosiphon pisum (strain 5AT) TaxID=572265 RepID=C4K360_HAMD5|nr:3-deoxy-manno-octulosonate cytidylyltransferase [Candidatus Hamiltonella defensa]ACQ67003.1 CTP:CMP-3-deoxy-D-manno-octulosonate transferase [Candidatus Hamiltonella defensa 5AT (Acyrthosiphon pisum)]AWK16789.1 3-deoxy-manno-octulosonate cytidylyltransferase [Candidatus Hamiltonella defensa]MBK4361473.1 3-deoxy-manno-octulosonate cytidylyltransferase [Candidatus Hamiltonella defensa]
MSFVIVIPARYGSTRLPGKPLIDIQGKPMVLHVMERAREAGADRVIVATDHIEILQVIKSAGGEACFTSSEHSSGTERLAEVIEKYRFSDTDIIVNVQGDEPMIPPIIIDQVAKNLANTCLGMATLAAPITNKVDLMNPNVVKVVVNALGHALYFSRAPIPWKRDGLMTEEKNRTALRHIGIYAYRVDFVRRYINWGKSPLEEIEKLEQLRVLWHGEKIHVDIVKKIPPQGIDSPEDLEKIRKILPDY